MTNSITWRQSLIFYNRYGNGDTPVFCFHGYGESAEHYRFLDKEASLQQFSFLAIDLPWHSQTKWKEPLNWTAEELHELLIAILVNENLAPSNPFYIIGFSMGGRIALDYYEHYPQLVSKLILLAPDGIRKSPWYWFSTQTLPGKFIFKNTMEHPTLFFRLLTIGKKLGLVNASIFKFVYYYIGDAEARGMLYKRWITFRKFYPSVSRCRQEIKKHNTPVRLLLGRHDRIILPAYGQRLAKNLKDQVMVRIVPTGHQILQAKHKEEIVSAVLS